MGDCSPSTNEGVEGGERGRLHKAMNMNTNTLLTEVAKNAAYVATRRKAAVDDPSRYDRLMAVDGDNELLMRYCQDANSEIARSLAIPYTLSPRMEALLEQEKERYIIAYVTAHWLQTVSPEDASYYDLLAMRLLDHLCEIAYRKRANRPVRRRLCPF